MSDFQNKSCSIRSLPFETNIVKKKCANLVINEDSFQSDDLRSACQYLNNQCFDHVVAKVSSHRYDIFNELEKQSFLLKMCSHKLSTTKTPAHCVEISEKIKHYQQLYHDKLIHLTNDSFSEHTRFHYDTFFLKHTNTIYSQWIKNIIKSPDFTVMVYLMNNSPAGFIGAEVDENQKKCHISLFAVDEKNRGVGIGAALIKHLFASFEKQVNSFSVVTEAINYPALHLYIKLGFKINHSIYAFHRELN